MFKDVFLGVAKEAFAKQIQKNIEDLRYSNGRTPQLRATAHSIRPHQGKAAVPKVTVAAEVEMISHWTLLHRAVL